MNHLYEELERDSLINIPGSKSTLVFECFGKDVLRCMSFETITVLDRGGYGVWRLL
jgi:hypothetical protein